MAAKKKEINEKQIKEWIERGVQKLEDLDCGDGKNKSKMKNGATSGWFWFTGFLGSIVYFWQYVDSFTTGAIAFVKACAWPAFLIYHLMKYFRI